MVRIRKWLVALAAGPFLWFGLLPGIIGPAPAPTPAPSPTPRPAVKHVSVTDFGANGSDQLEDSAAIQAANDAVAPGGGSVSFPAGTYLARQIKQDSDVAFVGASRDVSRIKLFVPTGSAPTNLIEGRQWNRSGSTELRGSIAAGSRKLTVNNASKFVPGSMIALTAAGGAAADQASKLSLPVFAGSTTLKVDNVDEYATFTDSRYLVVENEIVYYQGINTFQKQFTGLARGRWGTAARYHNSGVRVAQAHALVAAVESISGNTLTLDRPAAISVSSAPVTVGSVRMSVSNLTLDGSQLPSGQWAADPWPLSYGLARWVTVSDSTIRDGDDGGMILETGTRESVIERNLFIDNGDPTAIGNGHLWIFRQASNNIVRDNVMTGPVKHGVIMDDRTNNASPYDGPPNDNTIVNNDISVPLSDQFSVMGIAIYGGAGNLVSGNDVRDAQIGLFAGWFPQGTDPIHANHNTVTGNTFHSLAVGIRTNGASNVFTQNVLSSVPRPCEDLEESGAEDNTFAANVTDPGTVCPT